MTDPGQPPFGERLHTREDSGIRLDADGHWWHDDEPVEHPRIIEAFNQSLQPTGDGRFKLVFGWDWCFVQVDGPAYRVAAVHVIDDALELALSDRTQEPLVPDTLHLSEEGVLQCRVKGGRALARFSRDAQFQLGELLEEDPSGGFVLRTGGRTHPVRMS